MKSNIPRICILALAFVLLKALPALSQNVVVPVGDGGLTCPSHPTGYCEVSSITLPLVYLGPAANQMATGIVGGVPRTFDRWCVQNTSGISLYIPTGTFGEFQSFVTRATGPSWGQPNIVVGACCDPTLCATHNGNCVNCINEGLGDPATCCDWACPNPNDMTTLPDGFDCCQDANAPQSPLVGGVCVASCGVGGCQAWENNFNCCLDCGALGDGHCCPVRGENSINECVACPGGFCGDTNCCLLGGENRTNCADCAVCPDAFCTAPPETSMTCCLDCPGACGDTHCCLGIEDQVNCCQDCGCAVGNTCVAGACRNDCDTLPYTHDSGNYMCTINAVSIHGQNPAGTCAITGSCSATCSDGNIIGWINNCCTNWSDTGVCGPANGCPLNQSWATRTCSSIATVPLGACIDNAGCCTPWTNVSCASGACGRGQMRQQQTCGSTTSYRCVDDAVNCCDCDDWSTPGCGFSCGANDQRWTRECYPNNCASEDDGCQFYCGCAGTCCNNNGSCDYPEDNNPNCCDCGNCGTCGCQPAFGEHCGNCADCACAPPSVCNGNVCELPSCGALGGNCCGANGCRNAEVGASSDCTTCCDAAGCYPDPASASGSFSCEAHGGNGPGPSGSRTCSNNWFPLGAGWNNYRLTWQVYGHRHGTSDFNYRMCLSGSCQDGGNWSGGCLGFEYGNCAGQSHPANPDFSGPCGGSCVSGGTINVGPAVPAVFGRIYVDDAHAWIDWTVDAW